ncbi:hypothetical protein [Streptomyces sp. NBC_00842]|uniref:hypothetical protein n=1 Tax=Streptomyces sp. NBC_00842 TaxID=2975848 RepID=UPI002F914D8C|nr:hypothetical protein OH821_45345 [Streptomyces sp. NBC_00842]
MANAVMTHAPIQPREIHPHRLAAPIAEQVDALLNQADWHADRLELSASALLHHQAIQLIGIRPPASGELARCSCQNCYCSAIFDAAKARTYMDGPIEFVQCETCADEHRLTGDE